MVLRVSHGQLPHRPNRVPRASCLPRATRPHERTLGRRGRSAAPAPDSPRGVRGRARSFPGSRPHHAVRPPIPARDACRLRSQLPALATGAGRTSPVVSIAAYAACRR